MCLLSTAARLMGPARARPMVLGVPELQRGKSGEGKGDAGNGHCCKHPPCQQVEPTARTVGLEETSVVHEFSLSLPLGHWHFRAYPREGHNSIAEVGTRTKDKEPDARRNPHRRARSASQNGISRGPRACRVRVPIAAGGAPQAPHRRLRPQGGRGQPAPHLRNHERLRTRPELRRHGRQLHPDAARPGPPGTALRRSSVSH